MIQVSIPSLQREVDESGKLRKLYKVEVLYNGRQHYVLRSHGKFQDLHRKLRKIVSTPDFPSKRSPHLRIKPEEQRRQDLEDYVQEVLDQNEEVPQVLLDFLHVRHFHSKISSLESLDDLESQNYRYQSPHQRVMGYFADPYISDGTSDLPDVVVDGVLQGFYPRDTTVRFTACTKPSPPSLTGPAPNPVLPV
ncbi:sorting nexin-22 [Lampris incognitus]|uniref:sorting nexin-22 n=1 Tax=Lampris incognitus TaxID=2546036 RepID=UPI0024B48B7B|nr:sorting nexin-22 [Lampris incognitus]